MAVGRRNEIVAVTRLIGGNHFRSEPSLFRVENSSNQRSRSRTEGNAKCSFAF